MTATPQGAYRRHMTGYDEELAEIYDLLYSAGVGKDYAREAAGLAELIKERKPDTATLLDVACGTGEHLVHFRGLFGGVAGVELSEQMAGRARAKLPGVLIHTGDMRDFALGATFDAVTCLFSAIGYLRGQGELDAALSRFAAHLNPGGVLVVEPWFTLEQWSENHISHTLAQADGKTLVRMGHSTREGRISRMAMHYLLGDPSSGVRHFTDHHEMTLFTMEEYVQSLAGAGFSDIEQAEGWAPRRGRLVATLA
jgi:SAM-dependent methyltransferase